MYPNSALSFPGSVSSSSSAPVSTSERMASLKSKFSVAAPPAPQIQHVSSRARAMSGVVAILPVTAEVKPDTVQPVLSSKSGGENSQVSSSVTLDVVPEIRIAEVSVQPDCVSNQNIVGSVIDTYSVIDQPSPM